ncbi:MAG: tetratricopeptide repeat protein, partial [Nitrososphaeraceae archaeon]
MGRKGLTLYDVGMLEEAVAYFDRVLDIESNNTLALYYKALALDKLGKYNEAITVRDKLLD